MHSSFIKLRLRNTVVWPIHTAGEGVTVCSWAELTGICLFPVFNLPPMDRLYIQISN